ncbi:MAG: hypothetical protein JSW08_01765 [archaeon]|nr:MAG: hypothetical protein JSW08_01765 [archaeon]
MRKSKKRKASSRSRKTIHHNALASHKPKKQTERVVLLLFLIFVVVALIVLFKAPDMPMTASAISSIALEKTNFDASEPLKGMLTLKIDAQDALPTNSTMYFYILSNDEKLSTHYVCQDGRVIEWMNSTHILELDPEGRCCLLSGTMCTQVVLNHEFDAAFGTTAVKWYRSNKNVTADQVNIMQDFDPEKYDNQMISLGSLTSGATGYGAARQPLVGARSVMVSELGTPAGGQTPFCTDSDNGNNPSIRGTCTDTSGTHEEHCLVSGLLLEYTCVNNYCTAQSLGCPGSQICINGVCSEPLAPQICINEVCFPLPVIPPNPVPPETPPVSGSAITGLAEQEQGGSTPIHKSLEYDVAWQPDYSAVGSCAFELIINSTSNHALHYYYRAGTSSCPGIPTNTTTDIYLDRSNPSWTGSWKTEEINIYSDWINSFFGGENDNLSSIEVVSHGKYDEATLNYYSQTAYFDKLKIRKLTDSKPEYCEEANKLCCAELTGYGNYYGDQLSCPTGYECWDKCTQFSSLNFRSFVARSETPRKYNWTEGRCQALTEEGIIDLKDECMLGGAGKGYTACLNTTSQTYASCYNWTNEYEVNLSKVNLRVPSENGTYDFMWAYAYDPVPPYGSGCGEWDNETCIIFSKITSFGVGTTWTPYENWTCGNWSSCTNGTQFANCTEINTGAQEVKNRTCCWSCTDWTPLTCPDNLTQTRTCTESLTSLCPLQSSLRPIETQNCTQSVECTFDDWDCDEEWGTCRDGMQYRECTKLTNCSGGYTPRESQSCEEPRSPFSGMLMWIIIIAVIAAVVVILLIKVFKHPGGGHKQLRSTFGPSSTVSTSGPKPKHPEIVSYIKEALASGASRAEIEQKLAEAGWPKEVINDSFNSA